MQDGGDREKEGLRDAEQLSLPPSSPSSGEGPEAGRRVTAAFVGGEVCPEEPLQNIHLLASSTEVSAGGNIHGGAYVYILGGVTYIYSNPRK